MTRAYNSTSIEGTTVLLTGANRGTAPKAAPTAAAVRTTPSYTTSFTVRQTPAEVFAAINSVRGWWSAGIDGPTDALGAEFVFQHKGLHRTTQRITEFVPGTKVVWHVTESHIAFVKDAAEWMDTEIVFEIGRRDGETELRFTHVGLVPAVECYRDCSGAWGSLINRSLRALIATGTGFPI